MPDHPDPIEATKWIDAARRGVSRTMVEMDPESGIYGDLLHVLRDLDAAKAALTASGLLAVEQERDRLAEAVDLLRRWVTPERDMDGSSRDDLGLHLDAETEEWLRVAVRPRLQEAIYEDSQRRWADMDIESEAMALAEEAFEAFAAVMRAVVKRRHGTRGTHDQWTAKLRQELAQVGAVLFNMAAIEGFDFIVAVREEHERWVRTDTNHDPVAALAPQGETDGD